ncbi:MAG: hypothetical protein AAB392_02205 [Patescibacteria group bacterium]
MKDNIDKNWKELLRTNNQTVFSSYVHVSNDSQNTLFEYVNDSGYEEDVRVLILTQEGKLAMPYKNYHLGLGETIRIDMRKWLDEVNLHSFMGSLMVLHRHSNPPEGLKPIRSMMSYWISKDFSTQVGSSGYMALNVRGKKEKQSFFMFCPSVISTNNYKTTIAIFNHSTEPEYNDEVTLYPRLNDEEGTSIIGGPFKIAPFGLSVLDIEKHFGKDILKTNKRYSITISHVGHVLGPLFFHVSRSSGDIISGRHTQPAAGIFKPIQGFYPNLVRSFLPFLADGAISLAKLILRRKPKPIENIKETVMD